MTRSLAAGLLAAAAALCAACGPDGVSSEHDQASKPPRSWEPDPVREGNLRLVTINVRNYPSDAFGARGGAGGEADPSNRTAASTDEEMLLSMLDRLDFDVLALQEIRDVARLEALLGRLGDLEGRAYVSAFATNEASGDDQRVGVVVRADRFSLEGVREHPEIDVRGTLRAGLSARVATTRRGGADFGVLVLHLASGDSAKRATLRADQAKVASSVVAEIAGAKGDADFVVLGDLNTARGDAELGGLDAAFATSATLERLEGDSACTSYFVKNKLGHLHPSYLDHVYVGDLAELDAGVPLMAGAHCFERSCEPFESDGPETGTTYWGVSDHCPVYFEIRDEDRD